MTGSTASQGSMQNGDSRYEPAASEIVQMLEEALARQGEVHVGTLLSTAAWLSGTCLYRAMEYPRKAEPGTPVLSDRVNEEGPKITDLFMQELGRRGTRVAATELVTSVPEVERPRATLLEVQAEFQEALTAILRRHRLDQLQGAAACAVACSILVHEYCTVRGLMDARLGAGIVSLGIVAAAKTHAIPVAKGRRWRPFG